MRLLILGSGAIGTVIADTLAKRDAYDEIILADLKKETAAAAKKRIGDPEIVTPIALNADSLDEMKRAMSDVDLAINATLPRYFLKVMQACLESGTSYLDMATDLAVSAGEKPGAKIEKPPIDLQLEQDQAWKDQGLAAMLCWGAEPGAVNVWARHAADQMDSVDKILVRDGDNSIIEGQEGLVSLWSPDTLIEEVAYMNPLVWTNGGFERRPSLEISEEWQFPEPIGKIRVWMVDHEEPETLGRTIGKGCKECNFMIGLGDELVSALKVLKKIGMVTPDPVDVKGVKVVPRDLVTALMPMPTDEDLQTRIHGSACVGVKVFGSKGGKKISHYLWNIMDYQECLKKYGSNALVWQVAMPPSVAAYMFAKGEIGPRGVFPPEMLDPEPVIRRFEEFGMVTFEDRREIG